MATSVQPAHQLPAADPFARREGIRIVGALTALLAAALLATGGLIWREHSRAHPRPPRPAPSALR